MRTGTCKFFNTERGYGFISPDDKTGDVFVHASALRRSGIEELFEGQKVSFESKESRSKPGKYEAATVRVVN